MPTIGVLAVLAFTTCATGALAQAPTAASKTQLVPFDISPFPYRGKIPDKAIPFLDVVDGDRRGHTAPRGGVYWEDLTYSDRRTLLSIPHGFDARRPAVIVVFFHGNEATLARDVLTRQQVPRQVAQSGLNAVLVAPQFAVNAADSSSGRFWEPGIFAAFLNEAAWRLAQLAGEARAREAFARAPVVILAYSGGYNPAAYALAVGGASARIRGVILLDALYAEIDKFADWTAGHRDAFLVAAYGTASRTEHAELRQLLGERGIAVASTLPPRLVPGTVALIAASGEAKHVDFVTRSWIRDPIKVLLARVPGFPRAGPADTGKSTPGNKP